jgi:hypothetical protein
MTDKMIPRQILERLQREHGARAVIKYAGSLLKSACPSLLDAYPGPYEYTAVDDVILVCEFLEKAYIELAKFPGKE